MAKKVYTRKFEKMFTEKNLDKPLPYGGTQGFGNDGDNTLEERKKQFKKWDSRGRQIRQSEFENAPRRNDDALKIGSVSSSWLDTLGYDNNTREAIATFKGTSGEFRYKMSYSKFLEWLNSPSKGKWLSQYSGKKDYTQTGSSGNSFEARVGGRKNRRLAEYLKKHR